MAWNPRRCLWFGTLEYSQWMPTPLRGATSDPESFDASGTLLNGGGWGVGSWGSHKTYSYEWPSYSSPEAAQILKSYRDGSYGRGLLYFHDPVTYSKNVLSARVADPSMAVGNEGASLVYGMDPLGVSTSGFLANKLPVQGAYYNLLNVASGFRGTEDAAYVSIPEGYSLLLGAVYEYSGSGRVFVSPQNTNGTIGTAQTLTPQLVNTSVLAGDLITGIPGAWIWLGKSSSGAASVTARALVGRFVTNEWLAGLTYTTGFNAAGSYGTVTDGRVMRLMSDAWVGGMGHSGARFQGVPSWSTTSTMNGGQVGYAASFRETGSWAFG